MSAATSPLVLSEVEGRLRQRSNEAPLGFWVYMLKCRDGSYYAGHTDDVEARLWQHQQGLGADWTKRRAQDERRVPGAAQPRAES